MEATTATPSPAPLPGIPGYLCIGTKFVSTEDKHYEIIGTVWMGYNITHYELKNVDTGDVGELEYSKMWGHFNAGNFIWE